MFLKRAKIFAILLAILVIGVLTVDAGVSFIGSVHVGGGSITAEGVVGDCGDGGCGTVTMNVVGTDLTAWCQNKGGNIAPGQGPVMADTNFTSVLTVDQSQVDADGNFPFYFHEELVPTSTEGLCPSRNWTVVELTGPLTVTLSVYESGASSPSDSQVFACDAVRGEVVACARVQ